MNSDQMVNWINIIAYEFWVEMLFQEKKKKRLSGTMLIRRR